jgi:hypothetical protein
VNSAEQHVRDLRVLLAPSTIPAPNALLLAIMEIPHGRFAMPERKTIERAKRDKREGKAPTTQAGEFVREEIEHIREGEHGARSAAQAIAIGLSRARRAGVDLPPPEKGKASEKTRRSAKRALEAGDKPNAKVSPKRSRAVTTALQREGQAAASETALSRHAKAAARERTPSERSAAARKAVKTKGPTERAAAAQKAARTRASRKSKE